VHGRPKNDAPSDLFVEGDVLVESTIPKIRIKATKRSAVVRGLLLRSLEGTRFEESGTNGITSFKGVRRSIEMKFRQTGKRMKMAST